MADLLIAAGLVAILATVALPAFNKLLLDARMTAHINGLVHAVHLAKQVAHVRLAEVVLCPSPDGRQCVDDGQWQNGWLLFVNENRDEPPRVDAGEATLAAGNEFEQGHLR
ncbi:MAG: pilus assembly FimT family protein, partial [Gammaproteobacteria bacterium]